MKKKQVENFITRPCICERYYRDVSLEKKIFDTFLRCSCLFVIVSIYFSCLFVIISWYVKVLKRGIGTDS